MHVLYTHKIVYNTHCFPPSYFSLTIYFGHHSISTFKKILHSPLLLRILLYVYTQQIFIENICEALF